MENKEETKDVDTMTILHLPSHVLARVLNFLPIKSLCMFDSVVTCRGSRHHYLQALSYVDATPLFTWHIAPMKFRGFVLWEKSLVWVFQRGLRLPIKIAFSPATDTILGLIKFCSDKAALSVLSVSVDYATTATLSRLSNISKFKSLQSLSMSCCNVSDNLLSQFKNLQELLHLNLGSCSELTDAGIVHIKALTALQSLDLSSCQLSDISLSHLQPLPSLLHLNFSCASVTDQGLKYLAAFAKLKSIKLGTVHISDQGLEPLRGLKTLEGADFTGCPGLDGSGLKHLRGTAMKILSLPVSVSDAGLSSLEGLPSLESLTLSSPNVTDSLFLHFSNFTCLKSLCLSSCPNISGAGLVHIRCTDSLEELDLNSCRVSRDGFSFIERFPCLTKLGLGQSNNFEDDFLTDADLSLLHGLVSLQYLDLSSRCKLTDVGASSLSCLIDLRDLNLGYCQGDISKDAVMDLLQHLPRLEKLGVPESCEYEFQDIEGRGIACYSDGRDNCSPMDSEDEWD